MLVRFQSRLLPFHLDLLSLTQDLLMLEVKRFSQAQARAFKRGIGAREWVNKSL